MDQSFRWRLAQLGMSAEEGTTNDHDAADYLARERSGDGVVVPDRRGNGVAQVTPTTNEIRERWIHPGFDTFSWDKSISRCMGLLCDKVDELEHIVAAQTEVIEEVREHTSALREIIDEG